MPSAPPTTQFSTRCLPVTPTSSRARTQANQSDWTTTYRSLRHFRAENPLYGWPHLFSQPIQLLPSPSPVSRDSARTPTTTPALPLVRTMSLPGLTAHTGQSSTSIPHPRRQAPWRQPQPSPTNNEVSKAVLANISGQVTPDFQMNIGLHHNSGNQSCSVCFNSRKATSEHC